MKKLAIILLALSITTTSCFKDDFGRAAAGVLVGAVIITSFNSFWKSGLRQDKSTNSNTLGAVRFEEGILTHQASLAGDGTEILVLLDPISGEVLRMVDENQVVLSEISSDKVSYKNVQVQIAQDGSLIATNTDTEEILWTFTEHTKGAVSPTSLQLDQTRLYFAAGDIYILDILSGTTEMVIAAPERTGYQADAAFEGQVHIDFDTSTVYA
ncbi:MAG: hypothetical protein AAF798_04600, partial [Bacteroidota bacterium]